MFAKEQILQIQKNYEDRHQELEYLRNQYSKELIKQFDLNQEELTCLQYLLAHSPLNDIGNLDLDFFIQHVKFHLSIFNQWNHEISSDLFLKYVLPFRVSNEEIWLQNLQPIFNKDLKIKVQNMTLEEAALEVNLWCHSQATYHMSDRRTISIQGLLNSTLGRCGEETVFLVYALRSLGIPARQVYTPRWAHTDSNHAWVEVWVGKWKFLGACEPEPVLNKGWFNGSVSRAIFIHTVVFGGQSNIYIENDSELIENNRFYQHLNLIGNYAKTQQIEVEILDNNQISEGVQVEFKLYNMAEFFTVCKLKSNHEGKVKLTVGIGSFMIYASNNEKFGCLLVQPQDLTKKNFQVNLDCNYQKYTDFELNPPKINEIAVYDEISSESVQKYIQLQFIYIQYRSKLTLQMLNYFLMHIFNQNLLNFIEFKLGINLELISSKDGLMILNYSNKMCVNNLSNTSQRVKAIGLKFYNFMKIQKTINYQHFNIYRYFPKKIFLMQIVILQLTLVKPFNFLYKIIQSKQMKVKYFQSMY